MPTTTLGPGALLRAARIDKLRITATEAARLLGKSKQWVSDYESGRSDLTLDKIHEICQALGIDPHSIDSRLASNRRK